jgi:outer membrane immunogenic protein
MRFRAALLCALSCAPLCTLWAPAVAGSLLPGLPGDWTGLYIGVHFGGAWGNSDWVDLGAGNIGAHSPDGIIGGGQLGFNLQSGPFVWGAEASLSGSSIGGRHLDTVFQFGPAPEYDRASIDFLGTLTGRVGYAAGPLLLYGKGGLAWAHARYSLTGFFAPDLEFARTDGTKWGWTAGAGAEFAFLPGWSGFVEYGYLGFGSDVASLTCTAVPNCGPPGANAVGISIRENYHLVKTGINFRF